MGFWHILTDRPPRMGTRMLAVAVLEAISVTMAVIRHITRLIAQGGRTS